MAQSPKNMASNDVQKDVQLRDVALIGADTVDRIAPTEQNQCAGLHRQNLRLRGAIQQRGDAIVVHFTCVGVAQILDEFKPAAGLWFLDQQCDREG